MRYESYRTVFHPERMEGSIPAGEWEIPTILKTDVCPSSLISFDKAVKQKSGEEWIHFFIHDFQFMRLYRNPYQYLPMLFRFKGVISPDCSVFYNYAKYRQLQSICNSREMGAWLQRCGIPVIPCVRWGKENTYSFAFDGVEPGGTIAVGTVGVMRDEETKLVFEQGFEPMLEVIQPKRIIVYGSRKSKVFTKAEARGIDVVQFDSDTSKVFAERCC